MTFEEWMAALESADAVVVLKSISEVRSIMLMHLTYVYTHKQAFILSTAGRC